MHWRINSRYDSFEHAHRALRPSVLVHELSLRFEGLSLYYTDDGSQELFDRQRQHSVWAWVHPKGEYSIDGFGSFSAEAVSVVPARRSFCVRAQGYGTLETEILGEADARLALELRRFKSALRQLSPRQFEEFVANALAKIGINAILTPATSDHGVDVFAIVYEDGPVETKRIAVLQCKHTNGVVGVSLVRELAGAMLLHKVESAVLVTSGRFSGAAHRTAGDPQFLGIELVDAEKLRAWWLIAQGYAPIDSLGITP